MEDKRQAGLWELKGFLGQSGLQRETLSQNKQTNKQKGLKGIGDTKESSCNFTAIN